MHSLRGAATGPITTTAGGAASATLAAAGRCPSFASTVRWPGRVPRSTAAAGSGVAPAAVSDATISRQALHAHVEDERSRESRQRLPVERRLLLGRVLVAGDEGDGGRVVAVGHRDARVRGPRDAGGHARDDLEPGSGGRQRLRLLAAPAEDEWIAALEAHDAPPRPAGGRRQRGDPAWGL